MQKKRKKRFVAGARCPKCQTQDTLMLYIEHNLEKLECVTCGYQVSQAEEQIDATKRNKENIIGVFKP